MASAQQFRFLCQPSLAGAFLLWFLAAVNIFLFVTSTLSNILILAALHKESSLHPPSKILLRSLALADLCVGIVLEPIFVVYLMAAYYETWNLCSHIIYTIVVVEILSCAISLLTLTAVSVDRLLALLLGIRYRQVVTSNRVVFAVAFFWAVSICAATTVFWTFVIIGYYSVTAIILCLLVSTCCYSKIYKKLLHHQVQLQGNIHQGQPNGHEPLNIARYQKTVATSLWIQFTLVTCYLPAGIVTCLVTAQLKDEMSPTLMQAWAMTLTLVFLNSTLNPILYCWKIAEVRQAVITIVRQICC